MTSFKIGDRKIGKDQPCYVIAEISCNHEGDLEEAKRIVEVAAKVGCDAVKIQTYTPDTICRNFATKPKGTIWENIDLYKLYEKAYTPWEWYTELREVADRNNIELFSSPFDETAVDFLEEQNVPAYKVASFEIVDTKLLEKIASTGKPVIVSSGMTYYHELKEALDVLAQNGAKEVALLKCNSGYPGDFAEANLASIPVMGQLFDCVIGLSDHVIFADSDIKDCRLPLAHITPLEAVKLGAKIVEVHLMLDRDKGRALMEAEEGGYDWPFSRTPEEMERMIKLIRDYERGQHHDYETGLEKEMAAKALGQVTFEPTPKEMPSRDMRPTLWIVEDIKQGEPLKFAAGKDGNFDSIRPGGGLHIRFTDQVEGKKAVRDIQAGTPLGWDMLETAA